MLIKDEEGMPAIVSLSKAPTTKGNGSKVWFKFKSLIDRRHFITGIKRQTLYFDNLVFNIEGEYLNDTVVYNGKYFKYAGGNVGQMKLLVGQVPYSIDWDTLGIDRINIPVVVKVDVSEGVHPLPTREAVKYTNLAKKVILDKIQLVNDELLELWNKQLGKGVYEPEEYFRRIYNTDSLVIGNNAFTIKDLKGKGKTKLRIKGLENNNSSFFTDSGLLGLLSIKAYIMNGRRDKTSSIPRWSDIATGRFKYYFRSGDYIPKIDNYLRSLETDNAIISKNNYKLKDYKQFLSLNKVPKKKWRKCITEYQQFIDNVISDIDKYEDIEVPKDFGKKKSYIGEGQILLHMVIQSMRWGKITHENNYIDIEKIPRQRKHIIYGTKDQYATLKSIKRLLGKNNRCHVCYTSTKNLKYMKQFDNTISVEEFLKGHSRPFKKAVTGLLCEEFITKWNKYKIFSFSSGAYGHCDIKEMSKRLYNNIHTIKEYHKANCLNSSYGLKDKTLKESIIKLAETYKLYDHSIYALLQESDKDLTKIAEIAEYFDFYKQGSIDILRDYLTICKKDPKDKFRVDVKLKKI